MMFLEIFYTRSTKQVFSESQADADKPTPNCSFQKSSVSELETYFPPIESIGELALMTSLCG